MDRNNDVLSYATNGGTNSQTVGGVTTYTAATVQTGNTNPTTYKSNDISDPALVAGSIKAVLDGLKSVGTTKELLLISLLLLQFLSLLRYLITL